jgi:hypothetical protein
MSGALVYGKARPVGPVGFNDTEALPISETTGGVQVDIVGGTIVPVLAPPTNIIYSSAAPEAISIIVAAPVPASLTAIYARLLSTAAAPRWIQIHLGAVPAPGAVPFLVGDIITPVGGNTQWIPPDEVNRASGWVVVLSSTQDIYTPIGFPEMITRALGRRGLFVPRFHEYRLTM